MKQNLDDWKVNFEKLRAELMFNYFACSFGKENRKKDSKIDTDFENISKEVSAMMTKDRVKGARNILIIGAGASMDSYSGIPGGNMLAKRIKSEQEEILKKSPAVFKRYIQDLTEIAAVTENDTLSFENYLYVLSKTYMNQTELRAEIEKMTGFRYSPVYFNEIVSHMLKHSMLDAIINFNFEETLDQALLEEIGEQNYYNIISDGHCIDLDSITANGTLKVPIYIKPHGTNSHKSTLRFTNKHYFDIPDDISTMLKCLLGGLQGSSDIDAINNKIYEKNLNKYGKEKDVTDRAMVDEYKKRRKLIG